MSFNIASVRSNTGFRSIFKEIIIYNLVTENTCILDLHVLLKILYQMLNAL